MSAFSGLLALRRYSLARPEVSLTEATTAVKHVSADDAYHDYETALVLEGLVPPVERPDADIPAFFRETITTLVKATEPWWVRLAPSGRDRVKAALNSHELQCLDAAGLFSPTPTSEIRKWWDQLSQQVRATDDTKRLEQGRTAERLTLDYEAKRLSGIGITCRPQWVSLDDNLAGYDVYSYDKGPIEPIAKLIEVKSTTRQPAEIYLTRNEWKTAVERAPHYYFHIWILPDQRLIELTPADIEDHIPQDRGDGRWQIIKIAFPEQSR